MLNKLGNHDSFVHKKVDQVDMDELLCLFCMNMKPRNYFAFSITLKVKYICIVMTNIAY